VSPPLLSEHALIQWYNPGGVLERDFNPALTREEGSDNPRTVLEMDVLAPVGAAQVFTPSVWTGLTQSLSRLGADLSLARFVEVWVNDMTQTHAQTHARLHIDFGHVSEDAFWQRDAVPNGRLDTEDANQDARLDAGEDTGLDGIPDSGEPGYDPVTNPDPAGDDYHYDPNNPRDYSKVNGTEGNAMGVPNSSPDTEDLDLNGTLDIGNVYLEGTLDLSDSAYVATDVARDYPGNPAVDPDNGWRLFKIPVAAFTSAAGADWSAVKDLRIWVDRMAGPMKLQIGGVHFEPVAAWDLPSRAHLGSSRPNPFRERTVISFDMPIDGPVRLAIYDVKGRLVRELVNGIQSAGTHQVTWAPTEQTQPQGHLPSGVYFCRLQAAGKTEIRRVVFLR
jgi:hypothetical protein